MAFFLNVNSFLLQIQNLLKCSSSFCQIQSEEDQLSAVPPVGQAARQAAEPAVAVAAMPRTRPSFRIPDRSARTPQTPRGDPAAERSPPKFQPSRKKPPAPRAWQLWGNNPSKEVLPEGAWNISALCFSSPADWRSRPREESVWRALSWWSEIQWGQTDISPLRSFHFRVLETNNRLDEIFALLCAALFTQATEDCLSVDTTQIHVFKPRQTTNSSLIFRKRKKK